LNFFLFIFKKIKDDASNSGDEDEDCDFDPDDYQKKKV
jgi:hypothetical protein